MKKIIYIILSMFLGIILGGVAVMLIEKLIIDSAILQGIVPMGYFYIREYGYISPYLSFGIIILGAIGGFFLGRFCWRKLYIERI